MKTILAILFSTAAFAQTVTVTGNSGGSSLTVFFKKLPPPPPTLKVLSCAGTPDVSGVIGLLPGASSTCKVTISRMADPAPAVTTVIFLSTNPTDITAPSIVTIPPGTDNALFTVSATTP